MAVRATFKKGRTTAKGQSYRVGHNDRQEDLVKNANHIDKSKSADNLYFTFDNNNKVFNIANTSFEEHEKAVYNNLFGNMLQDMNDRAIKARHKERVKTMDDIYTDIYKCPEETILQIDKDGIFQDVEGFNRAIQSYIKEQSERFPDIKILDYAIHADEASLHAHLRQVYTYDDKGITKAGQHKCLEHYGFTLPEPDKKRSQFNNLKIPFTDTTRTIWYNVLERELGLQINREVISPSQRQKSKLEANLEQIEALADANREYAESHEKIITDYQIEKARTEKKLAKEQLKHEKLENKELQKKIKATDYNKEQIQTLNEFELELNQKKESLERREREINRELSEYKSSYRELCKEREELIQYTSELKSELHELEQENEKLQHKSKKLDKALEFMQTLGNGEETVLQMFEKELERQRRHRDIGFDR